MGEELGKFVELPCGYRGLVEKHVDVYTHYVEDDELLDCVLEDGWLRVEFSRDDNYLGKAIYTFPVTSGKYFPPKIGGHYIIFKSDAEHIHVVDGIDSHCLGEVIFRNDVRLNDYELVEAARIEEVLATYNSEVLETGAGYQSPAITEVSSFG